MNRSYLDACVKTATLCLLIRNEQICLGLKKRKLGKGKHNGFGGMVEATDASIEAAMLRELYEETNGVRATQYRKVAELTFEFPKHDWDQVVHVYIATDWDGEPQETEEMGVAWFPLSNIPYDKMWDDDKYWLPLILDGKYVKGKFLLDEEKTYEHQVSVVQGF